jgi:hypothetical protein
MSANSEEAEEKMAGREENDVNSKCEDGKWFFYFPAAVTASPPRGILLLFLTIIEEMH